MTMMFKAALRQLSNDSLYLVLDDITRRMGDGYLSDNQNYLDEQKAKAELVEQEIDNRKK